MKQELPNLVDERRFRRREPEVERDEFGRVSFLSHSSSNGNLLTNNSGNGQRRRSLSISSHSLGSTFVRKS